MKSVKSRVFFLINTTVPFTAMPLEPPRMLLRIIVVSTVMGGAKEAEGRTERGGEVNGGEG